MPDVFKRAVLEAKSHIECNSCFFNSLKYPKCLVQYLLPFIPKKNYFTTRNFYKKKKEFFCSLYKRSVFAFYGNPKCQTPQNPDI